MNKLYQPYIILGAIMMLILLGCSSGGRFFGNTTFLFWNDYSLFVNHPKYGAFMVDDIKVLKANRHKVKIQRKKGVANFLPGAFDRGYGLTLFKNGKLSKTYTHHHDYFEFFEIGDLAQYGKPVSFKAFVGTKAQVQEKLKELKEQENVYVSNIPTFKFEGEEHKLTLILPSIAIPTIPIETGSFNEAQWEQKIEQRISEITASAGRYKMDIDFIKMHAQLFDYTNKNLAKHGRGEAIFAPNDRDVVRLEYRLYTPEIRISATSQVIHQLKKLDYSSSITEEERNKPQLLHAMQEVIAQSKTPDLSIEKGEAGLYSYYDSFHIQGVGETKYELYWIEVEMTDENKEIY